MPCFLGRALFERIALGAGLFLDLVRAHVGWLPKVPLLETERPETLEGAYFRFPVVPHAGHLTVAGRVAGPAKTVWHLGQRMAFFSGEMTVPSCTPVVPAPTTVWPREGPRKAALAAV